MAGGLVLKKIMFLGGSAQQIPAIQYAAEQGYYTVLCDYLEDNPGQYYAEEFHCISTTAKDEILKIAKQTRIDGIVAYASDPAATTAAYVSDKLNLPSNSYESVLILSQKDLFRDFLRNNGFNCPKAKSFKSVEEAKQNLKEFIFPIMIKPIDSSGSNGVYRLENSEGFDKTFFQSISNSRERTVIIEEYIEMAHEYLIGGDVFVLNGEIEFCGLLNCHRNKVPNSFIPIGKSYPLVIEEEKQLFVIEELQRIMRILEIESGAFNIEVMFDKHGKLYFIEIGPRNGGNMIPELLGIITGVDLVKATVEIALNNRNINLEYNPTDGYYSTYILHSNEKGKLKNIEFKDEIQGNIIKKVIYKEVGDEIDGFDGAKKAIGIIFLQYSSFDELTYKMRNMNQFIDIQLMR